MKILIDTNVILDVLGKHEGFYSDSLKALQLIYKEHTPCVQNPPCWKEAGFTGFFFTDE